MNEAQVCRGPDDQGIFSDLKNRLVLGHRRLSIIDLSPAGRGPMGYADGVLQTVFNGEIYNFLELKKELSAKGYKFKTQTDTEVVLALYQEYGLASFSKLRGMFAFALWDNKKQKLFLVRDRYGIKPLYYYSDSQKIIFASTVKAIEKSGLVLSKKNPTALIGFLLFGSVPLPQTTLQNVLVVSAGHYLERGANGNERLVKYYNPLGFFTAKKADDFTSAATAIRCKLEEAVGLHLISDAPLGIFLSGGLDSSVVAALSAKNRKESVTTLSIIFDEPEFSEQKYQRLVAQRIGSEHREIKITQKDFFASFNDIFGAMDQPTVDGVNTFFIAQAAKMAGLKAVLSGLGADEIFLGYSHFRKAVFLRKIQKLPGFMKSPLKLGVLLGDRYSKLNYFGKDGILNFYLGIRGLFNPKETAKILDINSDEIQNYINVLNEELGSDLSIFKLHPVDLLSYLELRFYLQNQLLKDTDFMSMFHSIEVRVPFLDHPLVEYLSGLSPEIKLNMGKSDLPDIDVHFRRSDFQKLNKPLLVSAVCDLLPKEILNRKKMGFTFPFEKWLKQSPITNYQLPISKSSRWSRFWSLAVLEKWL